MRKTTAFLVAALLLLGTGVAWAAPADRTTSDIVWTWGDPAPGESTLLRTDSGIRATYRTGELPAGQAITMWFIVFNNPAACADDPCSVVDLLFNEAAGGDFLLGAGNVTGASGAGGFGGSLSVGDVSRSAFFEIGMPDRAIGLTNPRDAEVHLALHTHGPALTGQDLKAQISSFLGGCAVFLGNEFGIADHPGAVPTEEGECTTFQVSIHK